MAKANRFAKLKKEEAGAMGIGTMIIFIAMVLTAAVAAAVLINTAYLVQQQAQETGLQAIQDVATGFKVLNIQGDRSSVVGNVTNVSEIEVLELKLGLTAGSPAIDMRRVIIEITDGTNDATLTFNGRSDTDGSNYDNEVVNVPFSESGVLTASGSENTFTILNSNCEANEYATAVLRDPHSYYWGTSNYYRVGPGSVVKVFINCNKTGLDLTTQTQVSLKIFPKHGEPTYEVFTCPSTYLTRWVNLY